MKPLTLITLLVAALGVYSWAPAEVRLTTLDKRLVRSAESFENVLNSKVGVIPPNVLARAQGILILREYGAGFGIGGKGGAAVAMRRGRDGRWGPPAFLKVAEGSFGFQIGVQRLDIVFLFMNEDSMKVFENPKFRIGVDLAATAGPLGANAEAKMGAPVLVYSDNAGLFAGAAFEGGVLLPDHEANAAYYNEEGITIPQILYDQGIAFPAAGESLRRVLENYEGTRARSNSRSNGRDNSRESSRGGYNNRGEYNNGDNGGYDGVGAGVGRPVR